jgi:hypothetical protein
MGQLVTKFNTLSLGYTGAALLAVALLATGASWFFTPEANSAAFGVALPDGRPLAFGYIKGMENVIAAMLIGAFVWRRDRVGTVLALLATLIVPIGDAVSAYQAGVSASDIPLTHALYVVAMLGTLILLGLGKTDGEREREEAREGIVLPRSSGKRIVLAAASLLIAAIAFGFSTRWMVDPEGLSSDFGAGLSGREVAFAYVKGFEDLFVSAAVILFALRRKRVELVLVLAISLLVVIGDQFAQTLAGFFVAEMFVAHVLYITVVGGAIAVLRSPDAHSSTPQAALIHSEA